MLMLDYTRQCLPYTLNFGSSLFNGCCNKLGDVSMYVSENYEKDKSAYNVFTCTCMCSSDK